MLTRLQVLSRLEEMGPGPFDTALAAVHLGIARPKASLLLHRLSRGRYLDKTKAVRLVKHKGLMVKRGFKLEFKISLKGTRVLIEGREYSMYAQGVENMGAEKFLDSLNVSKQNEIITGALERSFRRYKAGLGDGVVTYLAIRILINDLQRLWRKKDVEEIRREIANLKGQHADEVIQLALSSKRKLTAKLDEKEKIL